MGSSTILVVDDERRIGELVRSYLELEGHSVLVADTGGRALESASRSNPDLVVLDFGLPPGEGGGPPALHTPHLGSNWWM